MSDILVVGPEYLSRAADDWASACPPATDGGGAARQPFDTAHAQPPMDMVSTLRRMARESGRTPMAIVKEFLGLATGPGRLMFGDYLMYRLFDPAFYRDDEKKAFIGRRRNQELVLAINHRHEWIAIADDKVASAGYFAAYGLPVVATKAIFAPRMRRGRALLKTADELAAFLRDPSHYPLFCKPVDGLQSLGSMSFDAVDARTGVIHGPGGAVPIDAVVQAVAATYGTGYLFQDRLVAHRAMQAVAGRGLSTVRVVTAAAGDDPYVFSAAWKIIGGSNVADNYWRRGNILAGLDLATGRVVRAFTGTGFDMAAVERHPDTGALLEGFALPHWADLKATAVEGHRTLRNVGMIGWDIGITDEGPVIVEANVMPDLMLVQAANREGAFNAALAALVAHQKGEALKHGKAVKATAIRT